MIHEQPVGLTPAILVESEAPMPVVYGRCRVALEHLHKAFSEPRPLAVLAGRWTSDANYIFHSFLAGIEPDVTVVRIDKTCPDLLQGMRDVVRATGFEPNDMSLTQLERMFRMFLSFQRARQQRTVFLIEQTRNNNSWVRDMVRRLVALETECKFGLMVIVSRQKGMNAPLNGQALHEAAAPATTDRVEKEPRLFRLTPMIQSSGAKVGSMSVDLNRDLDADSSGTAPLKIILIHKGKTLNEMTMDRPRLMIGSSDDNDLCINDNLISRHHALLVRMGAAASVTDLNSRHGTYVNFRRIRDEVLIHQDIVSIGNYRLKFIAPDIR